MLTQKEIKQLHPLLTTENYTNFINDTWIPLTKIYQNIFCRKEFILHKYLFYKYICSRNIIDSYFRKITCDKSFNNYKDDYVPISYYYKQFDNAYSCKFTESFCYYYDSMVLYFKYIPLVDCGSTECFHFQIQYHFNVQRIVLKTFSDSQDIARSTIISFGDESDDILTKTRRLEELHMLNGSSRYPYFSNDIDIIKVDKPLFNEDDMSIIRKMWMTIQFWIATKIYYRKEKSLYIPECLNIDTQNITSAKYPFLYDANNKLFNYFRTINTPRENFYHFDKLLVNMILKCIDRQKDNIDVELFPLFKCYQFDDIFEQQAPKDDVYYESD